MRILIIITAFLSISINLQSQTFDKFFNMGVEEFNKGNFHKADSLFTLSIEKFANRNAYYNRGMVRKIINDSCGFCQDMMTSYQYFVDEEAIMQFGDNCIIEADTLYFTHKYIPTNKTSSYRYIDITFNTRCSNITMGIIIDNKRKYEIMGIPPTSSYHPLNIQFLDTHCYASYYLTDAERVYTTFINAPDLYFKGHSKKSLKKKIVKLLTEDPTEIEKYNESDIFTFLTINNKRELIDIKLFIADSLQEGLVQFKDQTQKAFEPLKTLFDNYYRYPKAKVFRKPISVEYRIILKNH